MYIPNNIVKLKALSKYTKCSGVNNIVIHVQKFKDVLLVQNVTYTNTQLILCELVPNNNFFICMLYFWPLTGSG